ncbi:MAG TPA: Crp/Fnr family transcriptional regulator [Chloroflexota bacterium]|nr:Crp/Fnr family transcriptional regulator [Chloroflexota bacterium]
MGFAIDLAAPPTPFAVERRFRRGSFLVLAGAPAGAAYLIRAGQVRVSVPAAPGRETTTAFLGPGQLVGLGGVLGRPTYHAFARAVTRVVAWSLPPEGLLAWLPGDPALLDLVLSALSQRLALAEGLLRDVALYRVAARIPDALERLGPCLGGEPPALTRGALAALVGARRETVSRAAHAAGAVPAAPAAAGR